MTENVCEEDLMVASALLSVSELFDISRIDHDSHPGWKRSMVNFASRVSYERRIKDISDILSVIHSSIIRHLFRIDLQSKFFENN